MYTVDSRHASSQREYEIVFPIYQPMAGNILDEMPRSARESES